MRKSLWMVAAACMMLGITACGDKDTPEPETNEVVLAVSGGADVTVGETDAVKTITVKASEAPAADILVKLTSDAAEGEAVIEKAELTLAKGETEATSNITFAAAKFPAGTAAKAITVTAATDAANVKIEPATTKFNVKGGEVADERVALTAAAKATTVNTTFGEGVAEVTFTLAEALEEDLAVGVAEGSGATIDGGTVAMDPESAVIAKGETSLTVTFTVPQKTNGVYPVVFSVENEDVRLETSGLSFTFVYDGDPMASIAAKDGLSALVSGTDVVKTITVSLNRAQAEPVTVNLAAVSSGSASGTLSASSVAFAAGEISKEVTLTFAAADFADPSAEVTVTVTGTAEGIEMKPTASSLVYTAKYFDPSTVQDLKIWYYPIESNGIETRIQELVGFYPIDIERGGKKIEVSTGMEAGKMPTSLLEFTVSFGGEFTADDFWPLGEVPPALQWEGYVPGEWDFLYEEDGVSIDYGYFEMYMKPSAIGKTGYVIFNCDEVTFQNPDNPGFKLTGMEVK